MGEGRRWRRAVLEVVVAGVFGVGRRKADGESWQRGTTARASYFSFRYNLELEHSEVGERLNNSEIMDSDFKTIKNFRDNDLNQQAAIFIIHISSFNYFLVYS